MLDLEKVVDQGQSTSDNSPSHKSESREPLRSDAQSSPIGEDTCSNTDEEKDASAENGGEGDVGAYFRIFRYANRLDRLLYAISFVGAIATGAALPLMTLVFGSATKTFNSYATGQLSPDEFQSQVNELVLYFVYMFVGRFVIGYIATLCVCIAAVRTTNSLRKAFLDSLLRKEISHFDMPGNGSTATQVTTNGNRINQGIAEKIYTFVMGVSLFLSAYIVALAVQWKLALITMSILPAIVLLVGGCIHFDAPIEARIVRIYSRAATIAQDVLGSIKTIRAFEAQKKIVNWYDEYLEAAHKEGKKKSIIFGIVFSSQYFLVLSGTALAFWQGFRLFQSGEVADVGVVFTVVLSVTLGATSILNILPQISAITNASSAAAELFSVIDRPTAIDPLAADGKRPAACVGKIEFRNVHFAYPARPTVTVLRNLNLSLPAGKVTALVGPSGCGKSTLVGLLERWYQPSSGQILLDGDDIVDLNTHWLRSNIRLVQQEPTLFQGSVFENVAKGLVGEQRDLPRERQMHLVRDACMAANAHEFIHRLPQGYDTQLGESVSMLSGGQRQRITIARSIISNPKILLCDEATSALDPRAENLVQSALSHVSKGKTTLVIAHKLITIRNADNIAVMANGKVVEQGTHDNLLELDGMYAAMVRAQDLGGNSISEHEDLIQDDADEPFHPITVPHGTRSEPMPKNSSKDQSDEHLTAGTLEYSLLKCVFIMLKENGSLFQWYSLMACAYVMVGGTYPAQAVLFSRLLNVFTLRGDEARQQADFYSLMFFVIALANLVGYFLIGIATNIIGQALTHRYRREMLACITSFDQDFFDCPKNTSGALTAKLSSAPSAVQELMSANLGLVVTVLVNMIASSTLGIVLGWKLGLTLVFGGLTVILGAGFLRVRLDMKLEAATETQFTKSASLASEAVGAIRTINVLTLENDILREYSETLDGIVAMVVRSLTITLIPYSFSQSSDFLVLALGFWYGCRLIASGEYTVTQFFVIFTALVFGGQAASQLFQWTSSFTKAKHGANYILWLRTIRPNIRETADNRDRGPSGDNIGIDFNNVDFSYRQRSGVKVLRGLSMTVEPGSYTAFVGPSGCGKSTVIGLVERFYDPTSGRITLNGDDISRMSPVLYRRQMSLVQQDPPLYLGSVRDNIAIGLNHEPSEEEVREACQQANVQDFISSLPEGLNTPCGPKGIQFSGGQRQRIAVARALIRKPRLLLLDEATSALDTQSERILQDALNKAASSRTTIAVAHRLSTIRHADIIFVVEDGTIVEIGTHEELQKRRGRYYAMCLAQSLDQA